MEMHRPRHGLTSLLFVLLMAVLLASKASSAPPTQLGVTAGTAPADVNTCATWLGQSNMWAEVFMDDETWAHIEDASWILGPFGTWVAAQPGRKFILGVPMLVKSPAGTPLALSAPITASSFKLRANAREDRKAISYQQQIN